MAAASGGRQGVVASVSELGGGAANRDSYKDAGSPFADLARSSRFEHFTLAFIGLNAVWIAVEVDYNDAETLSEAPAEFQVAEHVFCLFFTVEWFIRFMAYRRKQDALMDAWFLFDSVICLLTVIETWVLTFAMMVSPGITGENLSTLTVLRLLRLLRLCRITRLMRAVPEMMFMIHGLISATRSVVITLLFVLGMVYVFAIAFVQLARDAPAGAEHFNGVWNAMRTLTIEAILPDQGSLLNDLSDERWYFGALFFIFLIIATLTMTNMLIGILCEVACRVSAREKERMDIDMVRTTLGKVVLDSVDCNGDNRISKGEFLDIVKNENVCKSLRQVGVEAHDLVEHADFIYDEWDEDGSYIEKKVDFDEFMKTVLKLRGTNVATIRDVTHMKKFVKDGFSSLERVVTGGGRRSLAGSLTLGTRKLSMRDYAEPPEETKPSTSISPDALEALTCLPSEVEDLKDRMARLEELIAQVLQGQLQMQAIVKERLQPANSGQEPRGGGRASGTGGESPDGCRPQQSLWSARGQALHAGGASPASGGDGGGRGRAAGKRPPRRSEAVAPLQGCGGPPLWPQDCSCSDVRKAPEATPAK